MTLNSANTRVCDNPPCDNEFVVTGDGSIPYLSTRDGGAYFCSEACKEAYTPRQATTSELLAEHFREAGFSDPEANATRFVQAFGPKVTEITTAEDKSQDRRRFRISMPAGASLISCIISGDNSYLAHVGDVGIVHTPLRVGGFANVISTVHPDGLLREIEKIRFNGQIPLGADVIIVATRIMTEETARISDLTAHRVVSYLVDGTAVSRPSTVITTDPK